MLKQKIKSLKGGDGCNIAEKDAKFIKGCQAGLLFSKLHNGSSSTEGWTKFKYDIKMLMEPVVISYQLTDIVKKYSDNAIKSHINYCISMIDEALKNS